MGPHREAPAEKEIIRALKNLAKKADSVVIGTDFDREGELIGSDALRQIREVAPDVPVARARYSAFTKADRPRLRQPRGAGPGPRRRRRVRQYIDLIWGAVLTRLPHRRALSGLGNVRSAGRVQTPTLALVVERERERLAFRPEDYWVIRARARRTARTSA